MAARTLGCSVAGPLLAGAGMFLPLCLLMMYSITSQTSLVPVPAMFPRSSLMAQSLPVLSRGIISGSACMLIPSGRGACNEFLELQRFNRWSTQDPRTAKAVSLTSVVIIGSCPKLPMCRIKDTALARNVVTPHRHTHFPPNRPIAKTTHPGSKIRLQCYFRSRLRTAPAIPSRPVPRSSKLAGSGTWVRKSLPPPGSP